MLIFYSKFPAVCTKGTFRIDAETGVVWQADHLDAKLRPFYVLEIIAKVSNLETIEWFNVGLSLRGVIHQKTDKYVQL